MKAHNQIHKLVFLYKISKFDQDLLLMVSFAYQILELDQHMM
jgi:hypothetical protein